MDSDAACWYPAPGARMCPAKPTTTKTSKTARISLWKVFMPLSVENMVKTAPEQFNDMLVIETNENIASVFTGANNALIAQPA